MIYDPLRLSSLRLLSECSSPRRKQTNNFNHPLKKQTRYTHCYISYSLCCVTSAVTGLGLRRLFPSSFDCNLPCLRSPVIFSSFLHIINYTLLTTFGNLRPCFIDQQSFFCIRSSIVTSPSHKATSIAPGTCPQPSPSPSPSHPVAVIDLEHSHHLLVRTHRHKFTGRCSQDSAYSIEAVCFSNTGT